MLIDDRVMTPRKSMLLELAMWGAEELISGDFRKVKTIARVITNISIRQGKMVDGHDEVIACKNRKTVKPPRKR